MRVPSSLLAVLKHHAGESSPGDEMITVPAVALPVLEIPGGLSEGLEGAQAAFRAESVLMHLGQDIAASSVGAEITLCGLRPGLWKLHFTVSLSDNTEQAVTGQDLLRVGLVIPVGGFSVPLIVVRTRAATAPVNIEFVRVFSLERQTIVVVSHATTGVGEELSFNVCLYAARLL